MQAIEGGCLKGHSKQADVLRSWSIIHGWDRLSLGCYLGLYLRWLLGWGCLLIHDWLNWMVMNISPLHLSVALYLIVHYSHVF